MSDIAISHDKENNIVSLSWWGDGEKHIGACEELNLLGVSIVIDRDIDGRVKSMEIML